MSVSVANLIQAAKENADKVNDPHVSDAEWTRHIRNAITELQGIVANAYGDTFFASANFTITTGNTFSLSSLSPGFLRIKGVDADPDTTNRVALRPFNFQQRADFTGWSMAWWGLPVQRVPWSPTRHYRVLGQQLHIQPQEIASGNYRVYYVPTPTLPTSESDSGWTLDAPLVRWVEYIEVAAARRGLWKEESDTRGTLDQRLTEMRQEIYQDANQDENPSSVTDVGW